MSFLWFASFLKKIGISRGSVRVTYAFFFGPEMEIKAVLPEEVPSELFTYTSDLEEDSASSGRSRSTSSVDQASGSGDRSQPSALEQQADELILENLKKRNGDLAEGQKVAQVRRAIEANFEVETVGGQFQLVKQMEKEVALSKNDKCPATNAIFNEIKEMLFLMK